MEDQTPQKPSALKTRFLDLVYSPLKLRGVLTLLLVGAWYVGYAMPKAAEIDETARLLTRERGRLALAKDVERLRKQVARFEPRIPADPDKNEWWQYMLDGCRRHGLKVETFDNNAVRDSGPYKVVVMKVLVQGTFREVDGFLRWVETNTRLLRVDQISITPSTQGQERRGLMKANLVVLGIIG